MCRKSTVSCISISWFPIKETFNLILSTSSKHCCMHPPFFFFFWKLHEYISLITITDHSIKGIYRKKNHPIENICKTVQSSDLLTVVVFLWISRCAKSYLLRFIREITNYTYKYFQLRHMLKMKTTGQHLEIFIILNWRTWYLSRMFSTYVSDCSVKHSTAKKETDKSFNNLHIVPLNSTLV